MAKNYQKMAEEILACVGGEENVSSLAHCMTRLRFKLKDESKVNMDQLKKCTGVIQVMVSGGQHQVVIGTDVGDVYDAIGAMTSISMEGAADEDGGAGKKGIISVAIDLISGIFMPFMSAFVAGGLIKGFLVVFTTMGWMDTAGTTYTILYSIGDAIFYFLPVFLAYTAGKKFDANPFISMAVATALVYPNITALYNAGTAVSFIGIPITIIRYPNCVIPIILAVLFQAKFEKLLKRCIPQLLRGIIMPILSLVVTTVLTLLIVGPISDTLSNLLADGFSNLLNAAPPLAGALLGGLYPLLIIFGLHYGFFPIKMNNLSTLGYDALGPITFATNFSIAGCALGVFLKTRNKEVRQIAGSASISALIAGITEPAIYGVLLKYKRPYVIVCILNAIGGMIIAMSGTVQTAYLSVNLLTIPALLTCGVVPVLATLLIGFFGGLIGTMTIGFNDKMTES